MIAVLFVSHELHEDVGGYLGLCTFEPQFFSGGANATLLVDIDGEIVDGEAVFVALFSGCFRFMFSGGFKAWIA